jgi:hypothetical protein
VIALCMDRGPLKRSHTVPQTAVLYLLPVYPRQGAAPCSAARPLGQQAARARRAPPGQHLDRRRRRRRAELPHKAGRLTDDSGGAARLLHLALRNLLILAAAAYLLVAVPLPTVAKHLAYSFGLYGFVTFLMDGPAAAVSAALGMPLIPSFDEPWLSTSVAAFWSQRWNIPTASLLRWAGKPGRRAPPPPGRGGAPSRPPASLPGRSRPCLRLRLHLRLAPGPPLRLPSTTHPTHPHHTHTTSLPQVCRVRPRHRGAPAARARRQAQARRRRARAGQLRDHGGQRPGARAHLQLRRQHTAHLALVWLLRGAGGQGGLPAACCCLLVPSCAAPAVQHRIGASGSDAPGMLQLRLARLLADWGWAGPRWRRRR